MKIRTRVEKVEIDSLRNSVKVTEAETESTETMSVQRYERVVKPLIDEHTVITEYDATAAVMQQARYWAHVDMQKI